MVFQIEGRRVGSPFERFVVTVDDVDPPAIVIETPRMGEFEPTRNVYRYPSGELLRSEPAVSRPNAPPVRPFDFDGDGTPDLIRIGSRADRGTDGLVQVVSGANSRVLLEDRDELEYEDRDRAIPLGDIDADGFAELALLHPRMDRSRYDLELGDLMFGARSWISIVSGSRVVKR